MSDPTTPINQRPFRGTQVGGDDSEGPALVQHRQRLVVVTGPDRGLERDVVGTRISIGTADTNDIVLSDPMVSRRHCEIVVQSERYLLRDLGSTNGTSVSGTPVVEAFLTPGARIGLGQSEIVFQPKKKWVKLAISEADHFGDLYGKSPPMREVFGLLERVVKTDLSVIIVGETGTGKELVARALHDHGSRAGKPFVVVDCGAVSENLIESELFGHERGAFTGADRARAGAFELAHTGTIFLDEIGELPLDLQPKLLRTLELGEVKRVGASRPLTVNVRIVAATHRDLRAQVRAGKFREDLFYRLCVVPVTVPPLRQRRGDVRALAESFLSASAPRGLGLRWSEEALLRLEAYDWPGNVRQLRNVVQRALLFRGEGAVVPASALAFEDTRVSAGDTGDDDTLFLPGLTLEEIEREAIRLSLRRNRGKRAAVVKELQIAKSTVMKRIGQWGLQNEGRTGAEPTDDDGEDDA